VGVIFFHVVGVGVIFFRAVSDAILKSIDAMLKSIGAALKIIDASLIDAGDATQPNHRHRRDHRAPLA
jgi:hypothetical protein